MLFSNELLKNFKTGIEEMEAKELNSYEKIFLFDHLPAGTGFAIGNLIRTVLLNHVSGIAICGVEISDKNNNKTSVMETLSGVDKVTYFLIVELKKIIMSPKNNKLGVFCWELDVTNDSETEEKILTAADFKLEEKKDLFENKRIFLTNEDVEIMNKELVLATLSPKSRLRIKLYCQRFVGYHDDDWHKKKYFSDKEQVIALHNSYSHVKSRTTFDTKDSLVSSKKTDDKLSLRIITDSAIKPENALEESIEYLIDLFQMIKEKLKNDNSPINQSEESDYIEKEEE